ncbi:MAG: hypothetical protein U9Q81_24460 [Pseudomonadota bacterium]|nr:hypothetical protein [Pseudomonadota bacterium]
MTTSSRFAYVHARIQSRFADLPVEEEWQRLAAARTLASFLEEARAGVLREWVKGFSGQSDCHDLERGVRALYGETATDVAGWVPRGWREAVLWTRWLTLLPLLQHLDLGGEMPVWVARDDFLHTLLGADGDLDPHRLADAGAGALLAADRDLPAVWASEWRRRWPPCKPAFLSNMEALSTLIREHGETFIRARPDAAWTLRKSLRARLHLLFHRFLLQPAGPFIYLALTALDLEHLRAALVARALFAGREETP